MAAKRGEARERILDSAEALIMRKGADAVSIDAVAADAGSAKGLVHYHFKTKQGLMSAVAERVTAARKAKWRAAFDAASAQDVVAQTWILLTEESTNGTVRAWQSLVGIGDRLTDDMARKLRAEFAEGLCEALTSMLGEKLELTPTIPETEIALLLEAVVDGMEFQLASGADAEALEGAYAAAWLSILSLTRPSF